MPTFHPAGVSVDSSTSLQTFHLYEVVSLPGGREAIEQVSNLQAADWTVCGTSALIETRSAKRKSEGGSRP